MNYLKNIIENKLQLNYFILTQIQKEHLYDFTKNEDLRFLKYNSKNFYKLLLKSINSGFIIKLHSWDYDNLKLEYSISSKLKNIINFNKYLCYFEYELNFINYINNSNYIDYDYYNDSSIILMHNYHNNSISYIEEKNIYNIYTQFILSLYSAYYNYNIYFNSINIDLIFIIKNKVKRKYKYIINNKNIYLNNCKYKLIISDISDFNISYDNFNIDDNILNIIENLLIFNKKFKFFKKDLLKIKKIYMS